MQSPDLAVTAGPLGHQLLRQNIERAGRNADFLKLVVRRCLQQGEALDQFAPGQREQAPLRRFSHGVPGAPDALQKHRNPSRRTQLANKVHRTDVDTQFQRRRSNQDLQAPGPQPFLG